jgi:heterodisulfide reductase subunit A
MECGSACGVVKGTLDMAPRKIKTDVLVIGAGIAGMQASLDLADEGFKVLLVERDPSIGGKMIALSKVFPTLDCASCICTPKMSATAHHENITVMTYAEVKKIKRSGGRFEAFVLQKPRYVVAKDCIGCPLCEQACPVYLSHEFEGNLGVRKAIYVPFSNAIPQVALLDIENCIFCGLCVKACPKNCIDFLQEPEEITVDAGAVIQATGFDLLPKTVQERYGRGKLANVLDSLQVERLLAPHGPFGRVLRPSDGKVPDSVAYVLCAGSRDLSCGVPYCSRVCCMYSIKQAMLLSGALPLVDVTIYYMDIRAYGKGFEPFYRNAQAMGIEFVKGSVAQITEDGEHNPIVRFEQIDGNGQPVERKHDMVVLSLGIVPAENADNDFLASLDPEDDFVLRVQPSLAPARTHADGVFVAGVAAGPKDIPDTIVEAGAAATEASAYLRGQGVRGRMPDQPGEVDREAVTTTGRNQV